MYVKVYSLRDGKPLEGLQRCGDVLYLLSFTEDVSSCILDQLQLSDGVFRQRGYCGINQFY